MKTLGSLVAQMVKNPTAMRETWVPSLGWEDPLEEVRATHSSILAWRNSWTEEPGKSWTRLNDTHPYGNISVQTLDSQK